MKERGEIPQQTPEFSGRSTIKGIADMVGPAGKPYQQVELGDGRKIRIFDKKLVEGLSPGVPVAYTLRKNERGFWNVVSLSRAMEEPPAAPTPAAAPEVSARAAAEMASSSEVHANSEDLPARERRMMSMNALTNATTLLTTLISAGWVEKPAGDPKTAGLRLLGEFHRELMGLHDSPRADNRPQNTPPEGPGRP